MTAIKTLISRNNLIIHLGVLLFITKALLTFLIGSISSLFFNVLYLWTIWVLVSLAIDSFIFSLKPRFLFDFTFTEREDVRYRIGSKEMKKYLLFNPMLRFIRTVLLTFLVIGFSPRADWDTHLLISLTIGFLIVDPIVRKILHIKTPTIFKKLPADAPISSIDIHRNNPGYIGSAAWNAFESTRSIKTDL